MSDRPAGTTDPRARRPSSVKTTVLAIVGLALTLYVAAVPLKGAPALGKFLDPVHGVWAVARRAELPPSESRELRGVSTPVDVRYDDRSVPHIFASNQEDAWRALGYVHARDRLFQMELQTRAVAGTLSELLGARALPLQPRTYAQDHGSVPSASNPIQVECAPASGSPMECDTFPRTESNL